MLSAFAAQPFVELKQRDKSKIGSILIHSDQLLVGLSTGSLRIYRINTPTSPTQSSDIEDKPTKDDQEGRKSSELLREYEKFSKYPIEQLAVFREASILLSLSNGLVSLHNLGNYDLQEQLSKSKGASIFAATSNIVKDVTSGVPSLVSRLAVAVKRRLLLWSWHDGESTGETTEIALVSSIKCLTWASGTKILAGLTSGYFLVNVESQEVKQIIGPGSIGGISGQESHRLGGTMSYIGMGGMVPDPLATGLGETEMLLARDINTHFIDRNGETIQRRQIPWRVGPQAIGYSYPYLLALQEAGKGVLEVRNPKTLTLLQAIDLPGATLLQVPNPNISLAHQGKGFLVASDRIVWRMQGLNYDDQIDILSDGLQFDEAISLLGMIEDTLIKDKAGRLRGIQIRKAQSLFRDKQFRASLDLFSEVYAPPTQVIRLYPEDISGDLAIETHRQPETTELNLEQMKSPTKKGHNKSDSTASAGKNIKNGTADTADTDSILSSKQTNGKSRENLDERDLRNAVRELQAYLADVRRRLQKFFDKDQIVKDLDQIDNTSQSEDPKKMLEHLLGLPALENVDLPGRLIDTAQLVDTTLFRAHMYATPSLIGSLFRIPNFCDPEVVMTKLEEKGKYKDLIDFLHGKRLHRQALERLQKFGQADQTEDIDPHLHGPERTVSYLQSLPPELVDLILEFAKWPIQVKPDISMEIFLADTENAELLSKEKVLTFLDSMDVKLTLKYLEHVIGELNDLTPELHQKLVMLYLDQLRKLDAAKDTDLLVKFLSFLRSSSQYSSAKVMNALPRDDPMFYEARAIIFSKMGNHKQALEIYVFKLNDTTKAEEYCNQMHLEHMSDSKQSLQRRSTTDPVDEESSIYQILLNLYLNPPRGDSPRFLPAIELMARHGARLPATSTLELIPPELLVQDLEFYFRGRMRNANSIFNESKIVTGLNKIDALRVQAKLLFGGDTSARGEGRERMVRVNDDRVCGVCHKRLGGSVISVFPDNSVVHLGCANRRQNELRGVA